MSDLKKYLLPFYKKAEEKKTPKRVYQSPTWLHGAGTEQAKIINKELGLKAGITASTVADTARFDNNISRIFLGSVIPGYPNSKTRTKYIETDTGKELGKQDRLVPAGALKNILQEQVEKGRIKSTQLQKKSWFRGT